jgi:hypothetical protein
MRQQGERGQHLGGGLQRVRQQKQRTHAVSLCWSSDPR